MNSTLYVLSDVQACLALDLYRETCLKTSVCFHETPHLHRPKRLFYAYIGSFAETYAFQTYAQDHVGLAPRTLSLTISLAPLYLRFTRSL